MKQKVQSFGKFLSAMVMPNIGALIAFGFIAALFIESGWINSIFHWYNEGLGGLCSPMLSYLIPILIASTGGKMVGGDRGRVVGAIAVVGAIMSNTEITMLMAAMLMGPLGGYCIKKFDEAMDGHMPAGFEMLINNFSAGIIGMILAIIGYFIIGPIMSAILAVLTAGVNILVNAKLLPLIAVFIEPAKVLFLNNAINHGVFTPIATAQAAEAGKSIMYMLEPNPGPGLGVLLAYMFFCKDKVTKDSAPGAIIIHLFGGIHEIYFPYILMNPVVIIAPILGNMAAIFWFNLTGCGLVGPASPGSIIAYLMMTPGDKMIFTIIGVVLAAGISFAVASPIVRMAEVKSLEEAQSEMAAMKAESKGQAAAAPVAIGSGAIKKIIFACDAGMGSSAMGATKFRNRIKDLGLGITVKNTSVDNLPADTDIAVVQGILADRARKSCPSARIVEIGNFLADPNLDALYAELQKRANGAAPAEEVAEEEVKGGMKLNPAGIKTGCKSVDKFTAIREAGKLLNKLGYVDEEYIEAMVKREEMVTTYMGMGVAIPHGTSDAKDRVKKTGIVVFQYPDGVDFGEDKAQLVFGIAGVGDEHLEVLSKIATALEDEALMEKLKTSGSVDDILKAFN